MYLVDYREQIQGRWVHRLTTGDDLLRPEAPEHLDQASAGHDRNHRHRSVGEFREGRRANLFGMKSLSWLIQEIGDLEAMRAACRDARFDGRTGEVGMDMAVVGTVAANDNNRVA